MARLVSGVVRRINMMQHDSALLIGIWSGDVLDPPGSHSDEFLVFNPDGTGYQEYLNVVTCYAWVFRWTIKPDGRLRFLGQEELGLGDDELSFDRKPSTVTDEVKFSIGLEEIPHGRTTRQYRVLNLSRPVNDVFDGRFYRRFGLISDDTSKRPRPDDRRTNRST